MHKGLCDKDTKGIFVKALALVLNDKWQGKILKKGAMNTQRNKMSRVVGILLALSCIFMA